MKVFVVQGSTGEYSDNRNWLVRGFLSEEKAKEAVSKLTEMAAAYLAKKDATEDFHLIEYDSKRLPEWLGEHVPGLLEADPDFQQDYSGTFYTYATIEVVE